ncbi:hypothetical protein DC346_10910 [Acinetobacter junii]|uniref:Uncharacterized protein n=1 Tax=Acinetobacter junii TaxID=40215 RepID=A0A365PHE6_ACIJU|nr:hypothetical protein DDF86_09985 [Acinetobacter junii]RBA41749.1 hypothetical protein DDG62_05125 [Acinetobacter junii]RBA46162.1 hypothetical protein DC346_10910 [Acinetobacter junii]
MQRRHPCRLCSCLALLSKRCFEIAQDEPSVQQKNVTLDLSKVKSTYYRSLITFERFHSRTKF